MYVRRVVTGQSFTGQSVVVRDDRVAPVTVALLPGAEFHSLWGSDAQVTLPVDGQRPKAPTWFPSVGGFRFGFFTLPPAGTPGQSDIPLEAALAEFADKVPGMLETLEPDNPGMHTSDTIDFVHIVSGEVWLELDDGAQTRLSAGDCVIQNGTRHAWRNKSPEPCVMALALVGVARSPATDTSWAEPMSAVAP